jgi:UDP-glucuronate 4-epimerase
MTILVTGVAGFIGMHSARLLLERGDSVIGIDNINSYYDVELKKSRLNELTNFKDFKFLELDVSDLQGINNIFSDHQIDRVVHLAAQAGVRYSISNPNLYVESNLRGFLNILEACRNFRVKHLVYASSSSVYGANTALPFSEHHNLDHPVSLYAATKKANELMAHAYSHLYDVPTTGLRFFTVYGPWGRPDMALSLYTKAILAGQPINVFNHGKMVRDFTFIDDIVKGTILVAGKPSNFNSAFDSANLDPGSSSAPYRVFNIGAGTPTTLMDYIQALECSLGITAIKNL